MSLAGWNKGLPEKKLAPDIWTELESIAITSYGQEKRLKPL